MASTIEGIAQTARENLDAAYAADPTGDIEAMKAAVIEELVPSSDDEASWLELATQTPDELIIVNTAVYGEMYTNGLAIVQAALDDEGNILQGE